MDIVHHPKATLLTVRLIYVPGRRVVLKEINLVLIGFKEFNGNVFKM